MATKFPRKSKIPSRSSSHRPTSIASSETRNSVTMPTNAAAAMTAALTAFRPDVTGSSSTGGLAHRKA